MSNDNRRAKTPGVLEGANVVLSIATIIIFVTVVVIVGLILLGLPIPDVTLVTN